MIILKQLKKEQMVLNGRTTPHNKYSAFVRTALCVEVRDNKLCIFLPPIEKTEVFLDLITSIEETAKD